MALSPLQKKKHAYEEEEIGKTDTGTPIRYLPLDHVYSTAPCVSASGSSNVMSKKVKARKLTDSYLDLDDSTQMKKQISTFESYANVYTRRGKKPSCDTDKPSGSGSSNLDVPESNSTILTNLTDLTNSDRVKEEVVCDGEKNQSNESENGVESVDVSIISEKRKRKRSSMNNELAKLGIDSSFSSGIDSSGTKERLRLRSSNAVSTSTKKQNFFNGCGTPSLISGTSDKTKKWVELNCKDADPNTFVGFQCKVFWPLDDEWYSGRVDNYNAETGRHHVSYEDNEEESLVLSKEKVKFHISSEEMQLLDLKQNLPNKDDDGLNNDELLVLAAAFDDYGDVEVGDIIWGKIAGHAVWPAVVVDESNVAARKALNANHGESAVPVQFFGTHDFAWITVKQVISFIRGLHSSYHLKCKQPRFRKSLEEAKLYLIERQLPNKMLCVQNGIEVDDCESASEEDDESDTSDDGHICDRRSKRASNHSQTCPFEIDDLRVISLGKVVTDSEYFHDGQEIWPEGYTAERKFISMTDTSLKSPYKMEVLRDPESKFRPLFRVITDNGEEFRGPNPSACWSKIYRKIRKCGATTSNGFSAGFESERKDKCGSHMFGFSNAKVSKLIKELSNSRKSSKYSGCKSATKKCQDLPVGYRPVRVEWKDLDKCNVCHMDEEYVNNVFLQCDKCRMLVHARCYGELEPVDGVLWLCKLCQPEAPEIPPPCRLCPVIGGAMKPTTDGGWAHLACAIWIPETCLLDIKKMEPIDGLKRISKDRWKLLCSICGVAYGACIQCSKSTCYVAYHPLCARAAGLCVELEDEDKLHLMSFDEDEDDQCIRFFSFCKKHRQPSNEHSPSDEQRLPVVRHCSKYIPQSNPSGCARTEPYDFFERRGRKEPEAVAAASLKRLYVENRPYLVSGYCQNGTTQTSAPSNELMLSRFSSSIQKSILSHLDTSKGVLSMPEKFNYMRWSVRIRLAFGKSSIHRYGVFAKLPHKAGDMMIEYTGEIVRPSVADRREHFIYNSLVGAGTYMFRIDDERVIDATRAGSIAHLINHSCEPNCYSRVVSVHGEEHIIIFAKRDISAREELTYDYRFFSIGEQLACYCGFPRCRGVVNDIEAEEHVAKLRVARSELVEWKGD